MTTLIEAVKFGSLHHVKLFISDTANIDEAFRLAARNGYLDIVKYLLLNGANIHSNNIALSWAALNNHIEVVKFLIHEGADVHHSNNYALALSAYNGYNNIVKYLIAEGADVRPIILDNQSIKSDTLGIMLNRLVIEESDLLPNDHIVKKIIDRINALRSLTTQRLRDNVTHNDVTIVCD